jgi:hypothetical protein
MKWPREKWTTEKPNVEGWYFWRKKKKEHVEDPFYWHTYFYCDKPDAGGRVSFWSNGVEVVAPRGGEWTEIK